MAHELREAWAAADRPTIAALAAALACAGAVYGYRGEDAAADDWFRFAESVAPHLGGQVSGVLLLESDVDIHRGCLRDAAERLSRVPEGNFWWRAVYAATRAEALVRAGDERCGEAVTEAEETIGDHRYARGVLLRARGIREDSRSSFARRSPFSRRSSAPTRPPERAGFSAERIARKPSEASRRWGRRSRTADHRHTTNGTSQFRG